MICITLILDHTYLSIIMEHSDGYVCGLTCDSDWPCSKNHMMRMWHSHESVVRALLSQPVLSLSFPLQFLSARLLVCSELQSGPRSFIQNQMRVWQPLHFRHLSARQLRLGKSSCLFTMWSWVFLFYLNVPCECGACSVDVCRTCCFRVLCGPPAPLCLRAVLVLIGWITAFIQTSE